MLRIGSHTLAGVSTKWKPRSLPGLGTGLVPYAGKVRPRPRHSVPAFPKRVLDWIGPGQIPRTAVMESKLKGDTEGLELAEEASAAKSTGEAPPNVEV